MKKNNFLKFIILIISIIFLCILFLLNKNNNTFKDTVKYNGKTYTLLEYNMDILTYNYNKNEYLEEDIIHPVDNDKWDIVYFNGDLFVLDKDIEEATKYYANDKNYNWFIVYEKDEIEIKVPISINEEELKYLYNIESIEKKETIKFDDIKQFVDIVKVSKDDFIQALTILVHCKDSLYWKTEIMNDNDEEYVIELINSLNNKIFNILDKS